MRSNRGTALVTGLIVMMMVSVLGITYLTLTTTNLVRANRDERRTTALFLAEAGIEKAIADLIETASSGSFSSHTYGTEHTTFLASLRSDSTGTLQIDATSSQTATITSYATHRGITEGIRVKLRIKRIGIWDNAIFAGIGANGRGINGNVAIKGSVHILGEGDPFSDLNGNGVWDPSEPFWDKNGNGVFEPNLGETFTDSDGNGVWTPAEPYVDTNLNGMYDPPLTATDLAGDLSGSAQIGNNYSGIPSNLAAKIPALVPQSIGGQTLETLEAEVRVKHGTVNLSGTATIGKNTTDGTRKWTVDGCYVTDGYGGNKGTTNVYSDNGTTQGYDLGDRMSFPSLLDPYTDPDTGVYYTSYENYLDNNSLLVSVTKIDSTVASFSSSGTYGSISWDQSSETLTISGIVRMESDLHLSSKNKTVKYSGSGTVFSKGSVFVHGSVMPLTMFPTTDTMGVIARTDIEFATGSGEAQLSGAGAWYAQRKIKSAKQNKFAGTYVSNYFDMGTNVPSIYQVPALSQNMPPGMPGSDGVVSVQMVSWKHL